MSVCLSHSVILPKRARYRIMMSNTAAYHNNNNNNNLTCKAPVCAKKTSVALERLQWRK